MYNKLKVTVSLFVTEHSNPLWQMEKIFLKLRINKEIIPEVKLVPEVQARYTNNQGVNYGVDIGERSFPNF